MPAAAWLDLVSFIVAEFRLRDQAALLPRLRFARQEPVYQRDVQIEIQMKCILRDFRLEMECCQAPSIHPGANTGCN